MLLEEKNAVVYGAGGAVGRAVARSFGREGASVFLAGRALAPLEVVAGEITAAGGAAEVAGVDALDEEAVNRHADAVVERAGSIDVSFNAISLGDVQGTPLLEMPLSDFSRPIITGTTTHLLTARAAARHSDRGQRHLRLGRRLLDTSRMSRYRIGLDLDPFGRAGLTPSCVASLCEARRP